MFVVKKLNGQRAQQGRERFSASQVLCSESRHLLNSLRVPDEQAAARLLLLQHMAAVVLSQRQDLGLVVCWYVEG